MPDNIFEGKHPSMEKVEVKDDKGKIEEIVESGIGKLSAAIFEENHPGAKVTDTRIIKTLEPTHGDSEYIINHTVVYEKQVQTWRFKIHSERKIIQEDINESGTQCT